MAMTIMARKNTLDLEAILVGCTDDDLMLLAVSSGFKWRFLPLEKQHLHLHTNFLWHAQARSKQPRMALCHPL
jgi:hypothetical protein